MNNEAQKVGFGSYRYGSLPSRASTEEEGVHARELEPRKKASQNARSSVLLAVVFDLLEATQPSVARGQRWERRD
jgi:hypothetical protein